MSIHGTYEEPPRAQDIPLDEENKVLKADYVKGIEHVLFGPGNRAITVQGTDSHEAGDMFSLPFPNYLARIAFLKLDDAQTERGERPFKLAVELRAHQIDVEKAIALPEDELRAFKYGWPDGLKLTLLDLVLANAHTELISFQPNLGENGEFSTHGVTTGYIESQGQNREILESAYQFARGLGTGATITDGGLRTHLEPYKVIADVLKRGDHDPGAVDNLDEATLTSETIRIIPEDSSAAERSRPYFYGMLKNAVETPNLRDTLAWQQHWHALEG
jgi:hypothetical protein